jgi:phosphoribosyl 1,2-cyclic phosphodiesterase
MLTLNVLASGSSGNSYLLSCDNETLILDCGIPIKEIKTRRCV